jgi:hypothetical protein
MINPLPSRITIPIPGVYSKTAMKLLQYFIGKYCTRAGFSTRISYIADVATAESGEVALVVRDDVTWRFGSMLKSNPLSQKDFLKKIGYQFKDLFMRGKFDSYGELQELIKTEEGLASEWKVVQWDLDSIHNCKLLGVFVNAPGWSSAAQRSYCEVSDFSRCYADSLPKRLEQAGISAGDFKEEMCFTLKQFRCLYELMMGRDREKLSKKYGTTFSEIVGEASNPLEQVMDKAYIDAACEAETEMKKKMEEAVLVFRQKSAEAERKLRAEYEATTGRLMTEYHAKLDALRRQFSAAV